MHSGTFCPGLKLRLNNYIMKYVTCLTGQTPCPPQISRFTKLAHSVGVLAGMAPLVGLLLSTHTASAQTTLMFRIPFDAAHSSATGTTNDATGFVPAGSIVLQTLLSPGTTIATTTPV